MTVPNIHRNSECPKPVSKVDPHRLLDQLWPPLKTFQGPGTGYLKYHPHFWAVDCESTDLAQEPVRGCRVGLHRIFTIFSASSLCFLFWTGMAVDASKTWKWNASVLTVLGRRLEFCGTNAAWISPHATAHGLNVSLGSGAPSVRVRRYEHWQLPELRALFHYLFQDLHSEQNQNKIPND